MSRLEGPLKPYELNLLSPDDFVVNGSYAISKLNARGTLEGLGVWVCETMETLSEEELDMLSTATALMLTQLAQEITEIIAERDSSNGPGDELPPVVPIQLVNVSMRRFVEVYKSHYARLKNSFTDADLDALSQEFVSFKSAYRNESVFSNAVDNSNVADMVFEQAWEIAGDRFPLLMQFCGGLASTFPNTATVESDFSILGYEKDEFRSSLTDFSLEGIMHSKQFQALQQLSTA